MGKACILFLDHRVLSGLYALICAGINGNDAQTGLLSRRNWLPSFLLVAALGTGIIALGIICQCIQFVVSIKEREKNKVTKNDPWENGRTLEWSIPTPAPFYNFAFIPNVSERDAYWEMKEKIF